MGISPRNDGLVLLTCDACGRYLKRNGRRSLLPAANATPADVDAGYQEESGARASAGNHEWSLRGERWLCSVCSMTTSFP